MRFLTLSLLAYGPFTNLELDLASPPRGVHVLYGSNEAGKSTTLRAIMGFLYGIPKHTSDAYVHRMPDLRVGAKLEGANGAVLDVVRRKGTVNTLLDAAGNPVDEAALRRVVGGVGEELFSVMFGLSHEALRRGGEALLQGKGDLGESLFGAGIGQTGLHDLREELEREAEELFTQKARTRPLNDALRAFADAQKKARELSLSSEGWLKQKQAIEEAALEQQRLADDVRSLQAKQHKLRRAKQARPLFAKRKQLSARLGSLSSIVRLPEGSTRDRESASRDSREASARAERLSGEINDLEGRRAALVVPRSLLEQSDAVLDVQDRLGAHRKVQADLPRLRGELHQLQSDARSILRRLGSDEALDRVESRRVDAATQARIKKLSLQPAALHEKVRGARRAAADVAARLSQQRARLASLPPPRDVSALRREVARAQKQGDLEQRLRAAASEHSRLEEKASARLAALGLVAGPLSSVASLPLPPIESVDRAEQQWLALDRQLELAAREADTIDRRRLEIERAIDEIKRAGSVPTEAELAAAREERDEDFRRVREALLEPAASEGARARLMSLADVYERSARRADAISDRLRREATRVAKLAALLAEVDAATRRAEAIAAEREAIEVRRAKATEEWRRLFHPAGIEPLAPAEMRGWLARHASVVAQIEPLNASALTKEALRLQIDEHAEAIQGALAQADEAPGRDLQGQLGQGSARRISDELARLIERGVRVIAAAEAASREREELVPSIDALCKDQERLAREAEAGEQELAAWREAWAKSVGALGLSEDASPEEATAILDAIAELFLKVDEIKKTQRRLDALEEDAAQFEADVDAIARDHAPDLEGHPADQAAAQLAKRYQQGAKDLAERAQIERELRDKRRELDEQRARKADAEARLLALMRAARAESVAELEEAERGSREALEVEREIQALDDRLIDLGEGASLEVLAEEVSTMDADRLAVDLEELDAKLTALEEQRASRDRRLGGMQADLDRLNGASAAADAAADAQESLARVRALTERYLRSRVAAIILAREIERYRERNQGPILARASELFQRLTLGAYAGVSAAYDEKDQPILRCVRPDGRDVDVAGLSDGARDQLFLSLRLASLERHATTNEPMPLIVDDILIHFDDERAKAALEALGELAERTQVLFFTHHARLLELARQAIPADRLREHRLR